MSNRWQDRLRIWFCCWLAERLPDSVKRLVLYDLIDRVLAQSVEADRDFWKVTSGQMYNTLRD